MLHIPPIPPSLIICIITFSEEYKLEALHCAIFSILLLSLSGPDILFSTFLSTPWGCESKFQSLGLLKSVNLCVITCVFCLTVNETQFWTWYSTVSLLTTRMCALTGNSVPLRKPTVSYSTPATEGPTNAPSEKKEAHSPDTIPYVAMSSGNPLALREQQ
jgi:hypothetical protein